MTNLAKKLNEELKNTKEAKEYFALKEKLSNDEYINKLLEVIKQTQNESKECLKNNDLENYRVKQQTLNVLKEEFLNHPLINNYIVCKNELEQILNQVVSILSVEWGETTMRKHRKTKFIMFSLTYRVC